MKWRVVERVERWPTQKKIIVLIILTLCVHATLIVVDDLWISHTTFLGDQSEIKVDLYRYIGRAETVLRGDLLYRDVHTETPPLINYLFVIPTAVSSTPLSFQIFLSLFNMFSILLIFYALKDVDEKLAFFSSLLYLIIPLTSDSAIFVIQDEPIVAFFFLLPIVLMRFEKRNYAALVIGLGIWVKAFPILLLPILLFRDNDNKERFFHLILVGLLSLFITLPYFILCLEDFTQFLIFYSMGKAGLQGISFWRFGLYEFIGNQGILSLLILLGGMGGAYLWVYKAKKSLWKSCLIILLAFFIFYRKIHSNYFLYPLALLSPFHFMDKQIKWQLWGIIAVVIALQPFAGPDGATIIPILPICLSLLSLILLLLITKRVVQDDIDIPDYPIISSISKFRFPKPSK